MKRLGWLLILLVVVSLLLPLNVARPDVLANSTKVVLDNGVEVVCIGITADGEYILQATIGGPKYLDDLVTPIEARWEYDISKGEWNAKANLFTALAKGSKVTVWYEGKSLSWQPDVFIGTKKQAVSTAQLIINDPLNENYFGNTLQWYYGDITRNVRLIEGMLQEYYIIDSLPTDDVMIISHSAKDAGFVWTRPAVAWDNDGKLLDLTVVGDDLTLTLEDMQDATFPITIDPDTSFDSSTSDGHVYWANLTSYGITHNATVGTVSDGLQFAQIGQYKHVAPYWSIWRGFVFFDTSSIPTGANITNATLGLRGNLDSSTTNFSIVVQNGTSPTYPHNPLEAGDYNYIYYSGDGGNFNTSGFNATAYNNITLNTTGIGWIQRGVGAETRLCLRSSRDIASIEPTGNEFVRFWAAEKGSGFYPQLVITYVASTTPTITTNDAIYITRTTARLNSYLNDDGGEPCDVRFQYGNFSGAAGNNYTVNTSWVNDTYLTGDSPYLDIANLTNSTQYFFRVQANNTQGLTNGSELNFTTSTDALPPTNFIAYPNSTSISLAWIKGIGSTYTMIRGQVGAYPANYTNGTQIYAGSMSTALHSGLTPGTTYYYRAWGYDIIGYSENNTSIMMTTLASGGDVTETPTAPGTPSNWWGVPDYTNLANIAGYGFINEIAVEYSIPENTFWMSLILIGIMCVGLFIYSVQHNATVALILSGAMIAVASIAGLLPLFMIALVVIPAAAIMLVKRRV